VSGSREIGKPALDLTAYPAALSDPSWSALISCCDQYAFRLERIGGSDLASLSGPCTACRSRRNSCIRSTDRPPGRREGDRKWLIFAGKSTRPRGDRPWVGAAAGRTPQSTRRIAVIWYMLKVHMNSGLGTRDAACLFITIYGTEHRNLNVVSLGLNCRRCR
jgi:hypothetical protein